MWQGCDMKRDPTDETRMDTGSVGFTRTTAQTASQATRPAKASRPASYRRPVLLSVWHGCDIG